MAGSVSFVSDILKNLVKSGILDLQTAVKMASTHILPVEEKIYWDKDLNIFV